MGNKSFLINIFYHLTAFFFAIFIIAPFSNEYFSVNWNINLNLSVYLFLFSAFSLILVKKNSTLIFEIELVGFFVLFLVLFFFSLNFDYKVKSYSLLIALLLSFLIFFKEIELCLKYYLPKYLFYFSFFVLIIILSDVSLVLKSISSNSRMLFDISPISVSVVACFFVLSGFFYLEKKFYKFFVFFLGVGVLLVFKSRGPMLSLCLVIFLWLLKNRKYFFALLLFFLGVLGMSLVSFMRHGLAEKSTDGRIVEYSKAILMLANRPFGYSNVGSYQASTGFSFPHNFFLEVWLEINILAPVIILFYLFYLFYLFFNADCNNKYLGFPLMILSVVFIVLQFSMSSIEMFRLILPLIFLSYLNMKKHMASNK